MKTIDSVIEFLEVINNYVEYLNDIALQLEDFDYRISKLEDIYNFDISIPNKNDEPPF